MLRLIDRLSGWLGQAAAWMFVATGAMITWEVTGRYLFGAPTIWAAELSQALLLWGTFSGMALLLRRRQHVRITMLLAQLGPRGRALADGFALLFIAGLAAVAAWYGWDIAYDSLVKGRSTGTMLNIPNWWTEMVIPVGFGLLLLQCLAELARLLAGERPAEDQRPAGH